MDYNNMPSITSSPPSVIATNITPQTFNQCMVDCFAQMGTQTREFVINTIKIHIDQVLDANGKDIDHYKQVINEIIRALDGDEKQEGFQKFVQLIADVNLLKQEHLTQQQIIDIVKRLFVSETVVVNNNFVVNMARNETFINEIKNNTTVINAMVNSVTTTIINYLSRSPAPDAIGDQFVAILSQFINNQVLQISNNLTTQITQVKTDLSRQFNMSIDMVQTKITQINTEVTRISTLVNNYATKEDVNNIRVQMDIFNSLRAQFVTLQSEVNELVKKCGDANFYASIDLSRNSSIVNITSQLLSINQSITELNAKILQCVDFVNKKDLADACAAACAVFVRTLTGAK